MNMDINIGRDQSRLGKAMRRRDPRMIFCAKAFDTANATVGYAYQRIFHYAAGAYQAPRRYRTGHPCLFAISML
jgi:hypothetical protein